MSYEFLFGPVTSSRLGRSLGLDLLGSKICDFDCLYCEVGPTRRHTLERSPYVAARDILAELERWLRDNPGAVDHITLGGMGEPCLNSDIDDIISGIRALTPSTPLAVLTNSSLLGHAAVARSLARCDVVLPSMDTLVQEEFERLNRPCAPMTVDEMAENLLAFAGSHPVNIFLEILLVREMNDSRRNLDRLARFCTRLRPERIDVVTLSRPGAYPAAKPVNRDILALWRKTLGADGDAATFRQPGSFPAKDFSQQNLPENILSSLKRRPQRLDQLSSGLGIGETAVLGVLEELLQQGLVRKTLQGGQTFYADNTDPQRPKAET